MFAKWYADATDAGNVYSKVNQNAMKQAMYAQLRKGAVTDLLTARSISVSFILHCKNSDPMVINTMDIKEKVENTC